MCQGVCRHWKASIKSRLTSLRYFSDTTVSDHKSNEYKTAILWRPVNSIYGSFLHVSKLFMCSGLLGKLDIFYMPHYKNLFAVVWKQCPNLYYELLHKNGLLNGDSLHMADKIQEAD